MEVDRSPVIDPYSIGTNIPHSRRRGVQFMPIGRVGFEGCCILGNSNRRTRRAIAPAPRAPGRLSRKASGFKLRRRESGSPERAPRETHSKIVLVLRRSGMDRAARARRAAGADLRCPSALQRRGRGGVLGARRARHPSAKQRPGDPGDQHAQRGDAHAARRNFGGPQRRALRPPLSQRRGSRDLVPGPGNPDAARSGAWPGRL